MKRILLIILSVFLLTAAGNETYKKYIDKYSTVAIEEMQRTGIPASITMAQAILESGAGQAALARKGNNHFGIKCHNDWKGKTMNVDDDESDECFRVYANAKASFEDHSDFLRARDRYKPLFELPKDDYKAWAKGLKAAGYATDPQYANKLINIIETYELYTLDTKVDKVPESPLDLESPKIVSVKELKHKYKEVLDLNLNRSVYFQNEVPFIYAMEGESYTSIARANNLFLKEILKFNDLSEDMPLEEGTIVYLARKKAQGPVKVPYFIVDSPDETLYRISQRYGIRMACLIRLNLSIYRGSLKEGDHILLR